MASGTTRGGPAENLARQAEPDKLPGIALGIGVPHQYPEPETDIPPSLPAACTWHPWGGIIRRGQSAPVHLGPMLGDMCMCQSWANLGSYPDEAPIRNDCTLIPSIRCQTPIRNETVLPPSTGTMGHARKPPRVSKLVSLVSELILLCLN